MIVNEGVCKSYPLTLNPPAAFSTITAEYDSLLVGVDLFNSKLLIAGYVEDAEEFEEAYELARRRAFRVEDEFPRIQVSDLKAGIDNVRYRIDIANIEAFECDPLALVPNNEN